MKIYIAFEGSYSDRHIIGVWDDRALAEQQAAAINELDNIEEWEVNQPDLKSYLERGLLLWRVAFHVGRSDVLWTSCLGYSEIPDWDKEIWDYNGQILIYVLARNQEHAIKIATEKRAVFLATKVE